LFVIAVQAGTRRKLPGMLASDANVEIEAEAEVDVDVEVE
jgi:hypothetical protein